MSDESFGMFVALMAERFLSDDAATDSVMPMSRVSHINNGHCGDFADAVMDEATDAGILDVVNCDGFEMSGDAIEGEHLWVYWRFYHYDAECPEGVEDWRDLPFWKRKAELLGRPLHRRDPVIESRCLEASALFLARGRMDLVLMAAEANEKESVS